MPSDVSAELSLAAKEFSNEFDASDEPHRRAYQFFSFDIKNSTAYKRARRDWPLLVDKFYELTWDRLYKDDSEFRFWKHVGDEVLIYRRVRSFDDAWKATQHVHRVLHSVIDSLNKAFPKARSEQLSVKAASWLALCDELKNAALSDAKLIFEGDDFSDIVTTHFVTTDQGGDAEQRDFLGPTIDSGFRIAKHSGPGILVISFELAYVLCRYLRSVTQTAEHRTFCRLVGYERLSGIWHDRPYPIIWYAPQDRDAFAYFGYDDRLALASQIQRFEAESEPTQPPLCAELEDIAADVGLLSYIKAIGEILEHPAPTEPEDTSSVPTKLRSPSATVHCVAICVNDQGNCLVAKRLSTRRLLPDTWEWGCATLRPHSDFYDAMKDNYRAVFGIDIEFPASPLLGTYFIEETKVPGILFAARVRGSFAVTLNSGKHSEFRWVSEADARALAEHERVVDKFVQRIRDARHACDFA